MQDLPPIGFREATRPDLPAIVALLAEDDFWAGREITDPARFEAAFDAIAGSSTRLYVGEQGSRIVATYQLILIRGLSSRAALRAQIEAVRVASPLRGQGIGALLMEDAEAHARAADATLMQLTSDARRPDAHRFYVRLGYAQSHAGFKKPL
ncbi:GNAT family N-acetyltransferase [Palleronia sp.]|uniref:GNAT family N-acetyltransferase n=1 Tax=Palleronia sp. TaxID=1940284 RepID=UPI0035C804E4